MSKYEWALNNLKLVRAIGVVGEANEELLKAEYIKIGGLINPETVTKTKPVDEEVAEIIGTIDDAGESAVVSVKKRVRKSKDVK